MNDKIPVAAEATRPAKGSEPKKQKIAQARKPEAQQAGFCVYLGPTILGVIQHGTVYSGTKEAALASISPAVQRYPLIAPLMVTGDALPADRIKVKTPGNLLYVNYHKLVSELK